MGSGDLNPYEPSVVSDAGESRPPARRRWPATASLLVCSYYVISAISLPLVTRFWYGEVPVLAVVQLPKSLLKSVFQDLLLWVVHVLGLSRGSHSPDYMATHDLALALALALPALGLVLAFLLPKQVPHRGRWITAVLGCAVIDAVMTLWFDNTFHLKLFNASYF